MGYTHYFYMKKNTPKAAWKKICKDVKKVLENLPEGVRVCRELDRPGESPEISDKYIIFNGIGEEGHETCILKPEATRFECVKTAYKPYDIAVCATALIAKHYAPTMYLGSDGDGPEWRPAEELVKTVLGYDVKYKREEE